MTSPEFSIAVPIGLPANHPIVTSAHELEKAVRRVISTYGISRNLQIAIAHSPFPVRQNISGSSTANAHDSRGTELSAYFKKYEGIKDKLDAALGYYLNSLDEGHRKTMEYANAAQARIERLPAPASQDRQVAMNISRSIDDDTNFINLIYNASMEITLE